MLAFRIVLRPSDGPRHRVRQSRALGAVALVAVAAASVVVLASTTGTDRTASRPIPRVETSTPRTDAPFEVPTGQRTLVPDAVADVRGFDTLATVTNAQPEHRGDARLSTTVPTRAGVAFVVVYCRGAADLTYIYEREDGAGGIGRCAPDADTTLAPDADIPDEVVTDPAVPLDMTMWVAHPSPVWLDCWRHGTRDCDASYGVPPAVADADTRFGFAVYEHRPVPVLRLFQRSYEAVSTIDHVAWAIESAVTAAPGAGRLAFELPSSAGERLVDVYQSPSAHLERCRLAHADQLPDYETTQSAAYWAAVDATCGTGLRLVVDGTPTVPDSRDVRRRGHFTELGTHLEPHEPHRVEVEVDRGDPRNVRLAVVVRTRTRLP
jgi:hypothetical protein